MNPLDPFKKLVQPFNSLVPRVPASTPTPSPVPAWRQTMDNVSKYSPSTPQVAQSWQVPMRTQMPISTPVGGQSIPPVRPTIAPTLSTPATMQSSVPPKIASPVVARPPQTPSYPALTGQTPQQMAQTGANGTPITSMGAPINPATGGIVRSPEQPQAPQAPIIPPKSRTDVESALKAYNAAQQISPEEEAAQAELDRLQEGTILGLNKIRDQAIPLDFITGQSASLERSSLAAQVPLEQKLARMQARRQAAIAASKFALDRADKSAEADKPIEVGGQLVQRDPTTGAYVSVFGGQKPREGFTVKEGETRYEYDKNGVPVPVGGGAPTPSQNPAVDSWVKLINEGRAKLSDVPNAILSQVASGLSAAPQGQNPKSQYALTQANEALTNIDTALGLLSDPNSMNLSETAAGRAVGGFIPGSSVTNLDAALQTVKALIGFDALQKMREASPTGGALGSITERELAFLQSVQGSLDTTQGTAQLMNTIARVKQSFEKLKVISSPDGTEFQLDGQTYIKQGDQFIPKGFSQVGGDTQQASRPIRNNNPLNIKASAATSTYNGVAGLDPVPASDGGHFLVFNSPEAGFQAAKRLIQTEGYRGLTVDSALRRWSNNGYGGEIVPNLSRKTIGQLNSTELDSLIQAMARNEGYYA